LFLKSIDIQGFKSFPDKIHVTFDRGITAIVGPNGSGKSNISDAIRWVMGEQSTKTLRGSKMEDVIFAGTAKRQAVGYAEVSLTIDNSDLALKTDYTEVTVTRRYYRSGESEFYINKKSVRLKDIHELFMDTGLGRDGYSMIGQGKIDEILSVKSDERREVFDEAAGITKYRYRKEEAERKLQSSEENLIRINDIISELESQLEPMRVQAEKERKFIELNSELKILEVNLWLRLLKSVEESMTEAKKNLAICECDLNAAQAELAEVYAKSDGFIEAQADIEHRLENEKAKQAEVKAAITRIETEITLKRSFIERNLRDNNRLKQETESYTQRIDEINGLIAERKAVISQSAEKSQSISEELAKQRSARSELNYSIRLLDKSVEEERINDLTLRAKLSEVSIKISSAAASEREIAERMAELEAMKGEREERSKQLLERIADMEHQVKEAEEAIASAGNICTGYKMRYENKRRSYDSAAESFSRKTIEIADISNRLKLLTELEKEYEGFGRAVKLIMRASEKDELQGINGPVSSLIRVPDDYVVAAETALGAATQNIVTEDEQCAKRAIELLKRRDGGRATFLPITSMRPMRLNEQGLEDQIGFVGILSELLSCDQKYLDVCRNLLGRTVVIDNMDNAIRVAKKYGHRFRIVTLDGQMINAGGSMTGGSRSPSAGILTRKNELSRLEARKVKLDNELDEAKNSIENLKREVEEARYGMESAQDELRERETQYTKAFAVLAQQKNQYDEYISAANDPQSQKNVLESRLGELKNIVNISEAEKSEYEAKLSELNDKVKAIELEKQQLSDRAALLDEKIGTLTQDEAKIKLEAETARASMQELEIRIKSVQEDIAVRNHQYEENIELNITAEAEAADMDGHKSDYESKLRIIDESINAISGEKTKLEQERTGVDKLLSEKNNRIINLEREKVRLESVAKSTEQEEESLCAKLWDNYEFTPSTAAEFAEQTSNAEKPADEDIRKRIDELKRKIRSLGTIYPGAAEEYDRISGRYEFMTTQRSDIEEAKASLVSVITELTTQMRDQFKEKFEEINKLFTETFTEIFGGGTARIELTDPTDVLTSGIEIKVSPPGKSLKIISLLSGGEKAFVAIALYFAIMKVRPAPFCVLDEIEAALDDVNVVRYAKYLRKLCDSTQYIVITHRRGTMEEADVLYGVAMPTQGVSKLLALNINDAVRELGL